MYKIYFLFLMFFSLSVLQAQEVSPEEMISTLESFNKRSTSAQAECDLGKQLYEDDDHQKAVRHFKKAAKKGNVEAMLYLGQIYKMGKRSVKRDEKKAMQWYRRAAKEGSSEALYQLGNMYQFSFQGRDTDETIAIRFFKVAAKKGHANAASQLGDFYKRTYYMSVSKGKQIHPEKKADHIKAIEWYERAAELGDRNARRELRRYKNLVEWGRAPPSSKVIARIKQIPARLSIVDFSVMDLNK